MGGNIQQLFRGMMLITFSAHLDKSFGYLNALVDSAIHQSIEHNLPASTTNIRGPAVAESANPASRYQQNRSPTRTIALENMHVNPNEQYNNPRTINTLSCADGVFLNGVGNVPNSQRIFESARSLSDYKIVSQQLQNLLGHDEFINYCLFQETRSPSSSIHDPTSIIDNGLNLGPEAEPQNTHRTYDYQGPAHIEDINLVCKTPFSINSAYFPPTPTKGKRGRFSSVNPYGDNNQEFNAGRLEAKYPKFSSECREATNAEFLKEFQGNNHFPSKFDHLIHHQGAGQNFEAPSSNQGTGNTFNRIQQNGPEIDHFMLNEPLRSPISSTQIHDQNFLTHFPNFLQTSKEKFLQSNVANEYYSNSNSEKSNKKVSFNNGINKGDDSISCFPANDFNLGYKNFNTGNPSIREKEFKNSGLNNYHDNERLNFISQPKPNLGKFGTLPLVHPYGYRNPNFDHLMHHQGACNYFAAPSSNKKIRTICDKIKINGPQVDNFVANEPLRNPMSGNISGKNMSLTQRKNTFGNILRTENDKAFPYNVENQNYSNYKPERFNMKIQLNNGQNMLHNSFSDIQDNAHDSEYHASNNENLLVTEMAFKISGLNNFHEAERFHCLSKWFCFVKNELSIPVSSLIASTVKNGLIVTYEELNIENKTKENYASKRESEKKSKSISRLWKRRKLVKIALYELANNGNLWLPYWRRKCGIKFDKDLIYWLKSYSQIKNIFLVVVFFANSIEEVTGRFEKETSSRSQNFTEFVIKNFTIKFKSLCAQEGKQFCNYFFDMGKPGNIVGSKNWKYLWKFLESFILESDRKDIQYFSIGINGNLSRGFKTFFNDIFCYSIFNLTETVILYLNKFCIDASEFQ